MKRSDANQYVSICGPSRAMSAAIPRAGRPAQAALTMLVLMACVAAPGCAVHERQQPGTPDARAADPTPDPASLTPRGLRVVSYNIRWPNPDDGADRWDRRRHRVTQTTQRLRPDVLGIQEAYAFQAAYLREQLPGYTLVGVGRDDGAQRGEMTAILLRDARVELIDHGHLWLSDTPDLPGSVGWDAALTRMATWAVVRDRRAGDHWLIVNTHFDHRGREARTQSANLLGRFILAKRAELGPDTPAVLMGDFNTAVDSAPYLALCGSVHGPGLIDTYRAARRRAPHAGGEGTFNGFRNRTGGPRIDWLLTTPNTATLEAGIDTQRIDGRNPSDHHPVWALLRKD